MTKIDKKLIKDKCTFNDKSLLFSRKFPNFALPPGFELLSLTLLSQIISHQYSAHIHKCFKDDELKQIFTQSPDLFDMNDIFMRFLTSILDDRPEIAKNLYDYSDLAEDPMKNIITNLGDKIFLYDPQIITSDNYVYNLILTSDSEVIVFGEVGDYVGAVFNSDKELQRKDLGKMNKVWTIYRYNNRYMIHFFLNSTNLYITNSNTYQSNPKMDVAVPIAACYYSSEYIEKLNTKSGAKAYNSKLVSEKNNETEVPKITSNHVIQTFFDMVDDHLRTIKKNPIKKVSDYAEYIKMIALDSSLFAQFSSSLSSNNSVPFSRYSVLLLYPTANFDDLSFIFQENDRNDHLIISNEYFSFIIWLRYTTLLLEGIFKEDGVIMQSYLFNVILSVRSNDSLITKFTFGLFLLLLNSNISNKGSENQKQSIIRCGTIAFGNNFIAMVGNILEIDQKTCLRLVRGYNISMTYDLRDINKIPLNHLVENFSELLQHKLIRNLFNKIDKSIHDGEIQEPAYEEKIKNYIISLARSEILI